MRRTLLYTNYLIPCRLSTDPEMYDLGWLWMAWMFIIRSSIGCVQCLRPKMLSDIFSFSFTLLLPNWLLISIRIYSGIARIPCDSMAFLFRNVFGLMTTYYMVYLLSNHKPFFSTNHEQIGLVSPLPFLPWRILHNSSRVGQIMPFFAKLEANECFLWPNCQLNTNPKTKTCCDDVLGR